MNSTPIGLSPDELRIVREILRRHVPDHEVWAFGSRAKGTARRYSDLDLAIMTEAPLPLGVRESLAEDFSESDLPFRVDILDWATTQENFRRLIEDDKIVLNPKRKA